MYANFLYYFSVALALALTTIGVSLGQSIVAKGALEALNMQPQARNQITRLALLGTAIIETSAVLTLVMSMLLLFTKKAYFVEHALNNLPALGIVAALGVSGLVVGYVSGFPAYEACIAAARQPFFGGKLLNFMLLSLSFIQTPVIFGFIFALLIWYQSFAILDITNALRLLAGGIAVGLGGVGPAIGLSMFSRTSCNAVGYNKKAYGRLISFSFITQAIIETPLIFAMVIALIILSSTGSHTLLKGITFMIAALTIGLGTLAPGIASATAASSTSLQLAKHPETSAPLTRITMLSQGFVDSSVIYCFLIAVILLLIS